MEEHEVHALGEVFCTSPPSHEEWMERRNTFTGFGLKLYNNLGHGKLPEKFRVFERELERSYCSGAHLSCIVFADTIVGIFKEAANAEGRKQLVLQLAYLEPEIQWLRARRNDLMHFSRCPVPLDLQQYMTGRAELAGDARQACAIVYHVARAYVRLDPETALQQIAHN